MFGRSSRHEQVRVVTLCRDVVGHSRHDGTSGSYLVENIPKVFAHSQTAKRKRQILDRIACVRRSTTPHYLKLSKSELKSSKSNCALLVAIDELCISLKVGSLVFRWVLNTK